MNVTECDNCRCRGEPLPVGWLFIASVDPPRPSFMAALSPSTGSELAGTFCTWRCVAEYAAARALVAEAEGNTS